MDGPEAQNVYDAPTSRWERPINPEAPDLRFMATWERRRAVYNVILVVEVAVIGLGVGGLRWFLEVDFWELLIVGAFGANLCFCAGPVGEAYLRWTGLRGKAVGPILFGLGTFVAILGTLATVALYPIMKSGF